jgi:hypothetical protein
MNSFWQDVKIAVRLYVRKPLFTIVVLAVLGLAIGVNSAIFTRRERRPAAPARISTRLRARQGLSGGDRHAGAAADLAAELLRLARRRPRIFRRGRRTGARA